MRSTFASSPTTTALLGMVAADSGGTGDGDEGGDARRPVVPSVPEAPGVPRQRRRQAVTLVRLCPSHGRRVRLGMLKPYVARMEDSWGLLAQVSARVGAAVPGRAVVEDLVFLDGVAQDFAQVARLLEGERSPRWKGLAAAVSRRGDALEGLLRPHLH